ncbi:MAG: hypothetical protein AB7H88_20210 [Vicinamibacterales bacterium]
MQQPWPEPPSPAADWDTIVAYADRVDGYRRAGSFEACMAVAAEVEECYRSTGEFPREAEALALAVFVAVRRYRMVGSPDGTGMDHVRTLLGAMADLRAQRAA